VPERLADWRAVLDHARTRTTAPDGSLRVELDEGTPLDDLTRLVAAEQRCCAFFSFAITIDPRGIALEVRAPDGATDIIGSLFGDKVPGASASGRSRGSTDPGNEAADTCGVERVADPVHPA
jgi:hypothetical protein